MAFTLDPTLIPYKTVAPAYATVTQNPIPHVLPIAIPYKMVAPAYATVTQNPIPHVLPIAIPYKTVAPAYAQVSAVSLPMAQADPDPDSTPYVEVADLVPDPGSIDVPVETEAVIPCGDRIPEEDETEINLLDLDDYIPPNRGLDPLKTKITVQYDTDPPEVVYENGIAASGWSVISTANNLAGNERDRVVGYTYQVIPTAGEWPAGTTIGLTTVLYDYGNKSYTHSYSFDSEEVSTPPTFSAPYPLPDSSDADKNTNISISINDDVGVDSSTINLAIDSTAIVIAGVPQVGYTVSITANGSHGYDILLSDCTSRDPDWDSYSTLLVEVNARDLAGTYAEYSWSFQIEDYVVPTLVNPSPAPDSTDVDKREIISLSLRDIDGSSIDPTTINLTVGLTPVIIDGVGQSGYTVTVTPNLYEGYDISAEPLSDWSSYEELSVTATVRDLSDNYAEYTWSFRIEDYLGVLVTSLDPASGQINVSLSTNITLHLIDEQDIVLSSIIVKLDLTGTGSYYVTAFEAEAFQPNWNGPESVYDSTDPKHVIIIIDPEAKLPANQLILVQVSADDQEGNPIRL